MIPRWLIPLAWVLLWFAKQERIWANRFGFTYGAGAGR